MIMAMISVVMRRVIVFLLVVVRHIELVGSLLWLLQVLEEVGDWTEQAIHFVNTNQILHYE